MALIQNSYKEEEDAKVLRLTWNTKFACISLTDGDDDCGSDGTAAR